VLRASRAGITLTTFIARMDVHAGEIHALDGMASLRRAIKGSVQEGRCIALNGRTPKDT
jgi:hypothetical protein